MADVRVHTPFVAVALGLSAHVAAVGHLPALLPTLLVVPVALLAVRAVNALWTQQSPVGRLVAGQVLVHMVLTAAVACATHRPESALAAVPDVASTAVHLLSLVVGVSAVSYVEQSVHAWVVSARRLLRTCEQRSSLRTADIAVVGSRGAGFAPRSAARFSSRLLRGPPTATTGLFA